MKIDGQTTENSRDSGVLSNPLSFIHSGNYGWNHAGLGGRDGSGYYWSSHSYSTIFSRVLGFFDTRLNPQSVDYRGYGFAVRCGS